MSYQIFTDPNDQITYIKYQGHINPEVTAAVYRRLAEMMEGYTTAIHNIEGCLFDFTEVTELELEAATTASAKSINFRLKNAHLVALIPTAMVVKTIHQEIMVTAAMKLARQNEHPRFRLVKSVAEAKKFFKEFNTTHRPAILAELQAKLG